MISSHEEFSRKFWSDAGASVPPRTSASAFMERETPSAGGGPACEYRLLRSGAAVPPEECESEAPAVELSVCWGANVLTSTTLSPARSFYAGEESGKGAACDFFLPSEVLGTTRLPLALVADGTVHVVLPPGARGFVELPRVGRRALSELGELAAPCAEVTGGRQVALPTGARAEVVLGDFVFRVAAVNAGKRLPVPFGVGGLREILPYAGAALTFAAGLLGFAYFAMPDYGLVASEGVDKSRIEMIHEWLDAAAARELEAEERVHLGDATTSEDPGGRAGQRAADSEGRLGKASAQQTNRRLGVKGNAQEILELARNNAMVLAANFGTLGILKGGALGDPNAPVVPWGGAVAVGADAESALGTLFGREVGDSFGTGLGWTGMDSGGGSPDGVGFGLDRVGTYGPGRCIGSRCGTGIGTGTGTGEPPGVGHATKPPTLTPKGTVVSGRLPAEVIRRTIRNNFGRFQQCYERGLARNPGLEGRVTARFIIDTEGKVVSVSNGGSDLPDAEVVSCVLQAYSRVSFPQPEDGIVTVVYPISFSPGG